MFNGCESWATSVQFRRRMEAAEIWLLRRMLRISWTARRTDQQVLEKARISRSLLTAIRQRQLRYLGHVFRGSNLEKDCLLDMIESTIAKGRQSIKLMDGVKEVTGCRNISKTIKAAKDRSKWLNVVANITTQYTARR